MEGMRQCHKCKKTIRGKMVYSGGWVWHPKCYPNQKALMAKAKKKPVKTKKKKRRGGRVEAYTMGEAAGGKGFPW